MKQGWHEGKSQKRKDWSMRRSLKKVTKGTGTSLYGQIATAYNCHSCSWRSTPICPHGLKEGEIHANKICGQRVLWLKDLFKVAKNKTKVLQVDESVKLSIMEDKMFADWQRTGELHKDFFKISRNRIQHLDKVRRQDEGIKINAEINTTMDEFRNIVEESAKRNKGKTIDAEFEVKNEQESTIQE